MFLFISQNGSVGTDTGLAVAVATAAAAAVAALGVASVTEGEAVMAEEGELREEACPEDTEESNSQQAARASATFSAQYTPQLWELKSTSTAWPNTREDHTRRSSTQPPTMGIPADMLSLER